MKTHPAWGVAAVVLVVANVAYFAWSRGALSSFGLVPERFTQSEPQRLLNQVRPALLQVRKEMPPARSAEAVVAPGEAIASDASVEQPAESPTPASSDAQAPQSELNPPDRSER